MLQHIDLSKLSHAAETELERRRVLEACRWPDGFICPRCEHTEGTALKTRPLIQCRKCRYQASATSRSQLHNNHTKLEKVFKAVKFCTAKNYVTPGILKKVLQVTYQTARRFCRLLIPDLVSSNVGAEASKSFAMVGTRASLSAGLARERPEIASNSSLVLIPSSSSRPSNVADDGQEKLALSLLATINELMDLVLRQCAPQLQAASPPLSPAWRSNVRPPPSTQVAVFVVL